MFKLSLWLVFALVFSQWSAADVNCHEFDEIRHAHEAKYLEEKNRAYEESFDYSLDLTFVRLNWGDLLSFLDRGDFTAEIRVSDTSMKSNVIWSGPIQIARNQDNFLGTNAKLEIPSEFFKMRYPGARPVVMLQVMIKRQDRLYFAFQGELNLDARTLQASRKRLIGTDFTKNLNLAATPTDFPVLLRHEGSQISSPLNESGRETAVVVIHRKLRNAQAMDAQARLLAKGQTAVVEGEPSFTVTGIKPEAGVVLGRREVGEREVIADLPLVSPFNPADQTAEFSVGDTVVNFQGATLRVTRTAANGLVEVENYLPSTWYLDKSSIVKAGSLTKTFPENGPTYCGLKAGQQVYLSYQATESLVPETKEDGKNEVKKLRREYASCTGEIQGFFYTLIKVKWNCPYAEKMGELQNSYSLVPAAEANGKHSLDEED